MTNMAYVFSVFVVALLLVCPFEIVAQDRNKTDEGWIIPCEQGKSELDKIISEAIEKQYYVRRIEIAGNPHIAHREFLKRMAKGFNERDIFTRKALEKTVRKISKLRAIYPISMNDVWIDLDRENEAVDFIFCVKERPIKK